MFCNYNFFPGMSQTPHASADSSYLETQHNVEADLYVSSNTSLTNAMTDSFVPPVTWDYDTKLHAQYNNNLNGGNANWTLDNVDTIRIKRREVGTFDWLTIFEVPVSSAEDFHIIRTDYTNAAKTQYEYAVVTVNNGVEGNYRVATVDSDFDGTFILDCLEGFGSMFEIDIQLQHNRPASTVVTMNRKYPFFVHNGRIGYWSGSASGVWTDFDTATGRFDYDNAAKYQTEFLEFLHNGYSKILKNYDGRIWLIDVQDQPNLSSAPHPVMGTVSFNWVEIGDVNNYEDLRRHGLTNLWST